MFKFSPMIGEISTHRTNLNCLGKASLTTIYLPRFSYDLYCFFSGVIFPDFFPDLFVNHYHVVLWKITLFGFLSVSIAACNCNDSLFEKEELRMSAWEKAQIWRRKYMIKRLWYNIFRGECGGSVVECRTPEREVGVRNLPLPCCVLEQDTLLPESTG